MTYDVEYTKPGDEEVHSKFVEADNSEKARAKFLAEHADYDIISIAEVDE